ncbi:hypothetical protein GN958_ATG23570, partial [Phytophthora infestans]
IILIESDLCYIGSTIKKLSWRWQGHKNNFRSWVEGKHTQMSIFPYFKTHGIENSRSLSKTAVNKNNAFAIDQLRKTESRKDNKEKFKAYNKEYYRANKHRWDAISKARLAARSNCECGGKYSAANHHVHVRSKKHKRWLEEQSA